MNEQRSAVQRKFWASLSPEEREAQVARMQRNLPKERSAETQEKMRRALSERWHTLPPEVRSAQLTKLRTGFARVSPERRRVWAERIVARNRERVARMTPDERRGWGLRILRGKTHGQAAEAFRDRVLLEGLFADLLEFVSPRYHDGYRQRWREILAVQFDGVLTDTFLPSGPRDASWKRAEWRLHQAHKRIRERVLGLACARYPEDHLRLAARLDLSSRNFPSAS